MPKKLENEAIVNTLVEKLKGINGVQTIETQLLEPKLIRQLYKVLGEPGKEDFPQEFETAGVCGWSKTPGYTTWIEIATVRSMEIENRAPTNWEITYCSQTKREIEDEYSRAGWHCTVQAYNVICRKYVKHPRYKNLWVHFYSTKDCSRYSYVIEKEEEE